MANIHQIKLLLHLDLVVVALAICQFCQENNVQKLLELRTRFQDSLLVFETDFQNSALAWFDNAVNVWRAN